MAEVKIEAFLDIESSLAEVLYDAWERASSKVIKRVTRLVDRKEFVEAQEAVQALSWDGVFEETGRLVELMLAEALLFGAAKEVGTDELDLSIFPPEVIQTTKTQMFTALGIDTLDTLKDRLFELIQLERKRLLEKSEYVFKSELFTSAAESTVRSVGKDAALMNASLANSRLASFGFLTHAKLVTKVTTYRIDEQLDTRICPVCEEMHGKTFRVEDAMRRLEESVMTEDPSELKSLMPWPSQSKAAVQELRGMSRDDLVSRGFVSPPFHPLCRGVLNVADQAIVEETQDVERIQDSFKVLEEREGAMDEAWLNFMGDERPSVLKDALIGGDFGADLSISPIPGGIGVSGRGGDIVRNVRRRFFVRANGKKVARHAEFELRGPAQGKGVGKTMLRKHMAIYERVGISQVELTANIDIGGYAWARAGFRMKSGGGLLKFSIREKLKNAESKGWLTADEVGAVEQLIQNSGDRLPSAVAGLDKKLPNGKKLGFELLEDSNWEARLDLTDPEQLDLFWAYVGGRP